MIERHSITTVLTHAFIIIGILIISFPIYMAFVASTHSVTDFLSAPMPLLPGSQGWENYKAVLGSGIVEAGGSPVGPMLMNSFIMAFVITVGKIAVSILSAFAIVYFRFRFKMLFFWLIFLTLMLPVEVRILPTFQIAAQLDMLNSYIGLTLPLIASATATFLFRQFFMSIPDELAEAARMDGASPMRFFWDVVLPLSKTNIAALFVIMFIYGWNQYLWPLLITITDDKYTIVMGIQQLVNVADQLPLWNYVMAATIIAMLPPVLVILLMQRWFVKGLVDNEK